MLCRGHARTDEFLHRLLPVLGEDVEAIFRKVAEACVYAHGGWQDSSTASTRCARCAKISALIIHSDPLFTIGQFSLLVMDAFPQRLGRYRYQSGM